MNLKLGWLGIGLWIVSACGSVQSAPTQPPPLEQVEPTRTPPPTATVVPPTQVVQQWHFGLSLPSYQGEFFSASGNCAPCHRNLTDEVGTDVSPDSDWRASMLANSAQNPYWQALVRAEMMLNPETAGQIEQFCVRCHMPMASTTDRLLEEQTGLFEDGYLDPDHPLNVLAMDGVSCSLCHQIQEEGLGLPQSYTGGFVIDAELPFGERLVYGAFEVDEEQAEIMHTASGYLPTQGFHITRSELCATCHMQFNPNEFPQQTTYFEWWYSAYRQEQTCQDCHMPEAVGGVQVAATSEELRSPFARHLFLGGNAYMLEILERYANELQVVASSAGLQAARESTLDQLRSQTAKIVIEQSRLSGQWITVDLQLETLTGHKFPTGFPARRAWIHFLVEDANGEVLFESGGSMPDGSISGNDNDQDPSTFEPHHDVILEQDQVQLYEAILGDDTGLVTTHVMRASSYLKDNRLLPVGLDKESAIAQIRVRGEAAEDLNFIGAGDAVRYSVNVGQAPSPYTVTIELLYQSIGYAWIESLRGLDAIEIERFLRYVDETPNIPAVVDQQIVTLP